MAVVLERLSLEHVTIRVFTFFSYVIYRGEERELLGRIARGVCVGLGLLSVRCFVESSRSNAAPITYQVCCVQQHRKKTESCFLFRFLLM